jgi:hypothetical protein
MDSVGSASIACRPRWAAVCKANPTGWRKFFYNFKRNFIDGAKSKNLTVISAIYLIFQ